MSYEDYRAAGRGQGAPVERYHSDLTESQLDTVFRVLSATDRRRILLAVKYGSLELQGETLVRGDVTVPVDAVSAVHNHLPKLADSGYVDWNRDSGEITKGERFDLLEPFLEVVEQHGTEPHR